MSSTDPTNDQFAAYRAMWVYFNTALFGGALSHVILNFSRLARSLGFFAPERWRNAGDQTTHEISLNPDHLTRKNAKDAASTLVHEMMHLWQLCRERHKRHYAERCVMPRRAGWPPLLLESVRSYSA